MAAEALRDVRKREAMGRLVSRVLRREREQDVERLFAAIERLGAAAESKRLTDEILEHRQQRRAAELIVLDTSTLVGAVIRPGKPREALHHACRFDVPALSEPVRRELVDVLHRPRLTRFIDPIARDQVLDLLRATAV